MMASPPEDRDVNKRRLLLNSASSAGSMLVNLTILVWLQQYLIKRISPDEYSLLPVVMSLMAFSPIVTVVLTGGIGRYVTIAYAKGDDRRLTAVSSTMFVILGSFSALFAVLAILATSYVHLLIKIEPTFLRHAQIMFLLSALTLCLRLAAAPLDCGMLVRQRLSYEDGLNLGSQLLRIGLLFGLLLGLGPRVLWVVVATQVAEVVKIIISVFVSLQLLPAQRFDRKTVDFKLGREIVTYGSWNLVEQATKAARQAADPLLLNRFAGAIDVATFHVAGIAPRQLTVLMFPLIRPFIPVLATLAARGDFDRMGSTYLRTARYQVWILFTFVVPGAVFANQVMDLYLDNAYPMAGAVMALTVFLPLLAAFNALGSPAAQALGVVRPFAMRQILILVFSLTSSWIFVVAFDGGARGAAAAGLLTASIGEALIIWPFCWKIVHVSLGQWLRGVVFPSVLPAPLSLAVCMIGAQFWAPDNWTAIFTWSGLSALAYWLCVLAFMLKEEDRRDLIKIAPRLGPLKTPFLALISFKSNSNRGLSQ